MRDVKLKKEGEGRARAERCISGATGPEGQEGGAARGGSRGKQPSYGLSIFFYPYLGGEEH